VFAQQSCFYDATSYNAGFSYNITVSYKLIKGWSKARPSEVYSVRLVSVTPDARGFYYGNQRNKFYSCSELGGGCNANSWQQVYVGLNGQCKTSTTDKLTFTRIGEEKTIEHWTNENEGCSFNGMTGTVRQDGTRALMNIIDAKDKTSMNKNDRSNNPVNSNTANNESKAQNRTNTAKPTNATGNDPLAHFNNQQAATTNKVVVAMDQISTALSPIVQNWADKREKAYNERKDQEEGKKNIIREKVLKNAATTSAIYESKAEAGDVKAMVYTGSSYCYTNTAKFYYWMKKAAALNDRDAYWMLYYMHPGEDPLNIRLPKSAEQVAWLQGAARLKHDLAMDVLWLDVYGREKSGFYNPAKALEYMIIAAENGSLKSLLALAKFYEEGDYWKMFQFKKLKNPAKAIELYETLTKLNNEEFSPKAFAALASMYELGNGVKKDKEKAAAYSLQEDAKKIELGKVFYIYANYLIDGKKYYTRFYECHSSYNKNVQDVDEAKEALKAAIKKTMVEQPTFMSVNELIYAHSIDRAKVFFENKIDEAAAKDDLIIRHDIAFTFDKRPDPKIEVQ
jgi:TPR repeat protein